MSGVSGEGMGSEEIQTAMMFVGNLGVELTTRPSISNDQYVYHNINQYLA
jgi:hypothetical protein